MFQTHLQSIFLPFTVSFIKSLRCDLINKRMPLQSGLIRLCLFVLLTFFYSTFAQNLYAQENAKKPKIGLVLSGGGAKGFAHIGVLKVLEQAGIKIDYIGGTSMGAVVGGLYASGYNATQIDSIFNCTNFNELLKDYNPRNNKSFYEKRNDELYAITLPFNKFKFGFPIALSKGLYNYNLLVRLTTNVNHITNFQKLPIPFLCVATDIETGKEVILKNGYLPKALLASSAFPSLFSPVEIDGKYLIDGGVINNYPIEEIRKMGADIIIGVDVQDDLKTRETLTDATRILVQITNLQMLESMKEKIKLTDIYIKPDISNFSVLSFNEGRQIIKKGEEATLPFLEQLKTLGNSENKVQQTKKASDSIYIKKIVTPILNNYTRSYIIGKLGFKSGKKISYDDLKKGISKLDVCQNFSTISYSLNKYEDGQILDIDLKESKTKTFLKFGLHYDGLYKSAVLVNLTQKKSLFKNDVLSFDLGLGDNFRYNLDYYIDNGYYFSFGFKSTMNNFNKNVATDFSDGELFNQLNINSLNIDFLDVTNQAYLQTIFAQKFLLGGGLEHKYLKIESKTLDNSTSVFEKSSYGSAFGYIKYDSLDQFYFPKKGWFFDSGIHTYLYSSNFSKEFQRFSIAKGKIGIVKTIYKKVAFQFQNEGGFAIGNESVNFLDFVLGGYGFNAINNFEHFYGYDFLSLSGDSYIKATATIDYEFLKKNHLKLAANYANIDNNLFTNGNWLSLPNYSGYAVGYGIETVIGPVEFTYSWSPELTKGYAWINVGFWF
jgi:NTE family protein